MKAMKSLSSQTSVRNAVIFPMLTVSGMPCRMSRSCERSVKGLLLARTARLVKSDACANDTQISGRLLSRNKAKAAGLYSLQQT